MDTLCVALDYQRTESGRCKRCSFLLGWRPLAQTILAIDRNLQISTSEPSRNELDRGLWAPLHVGYLADTSEVLLNLAACLITNLGWEGFFYHTLLLREPPNRSSTSFQLHPQPSWLPDPSTWTSPAMESFFMRKNTAISFPLPGSASVEDTVPKCHMCS